MFPDVEDAPRDSAKKKQFQPSTKTIISAGLAVIGVLLVVLVVILTQMRQPAVVIPQNITQDFKSSIYLPRNLPDHYKIDNGSFNLAEENKVLIFSANNGAGGKLIFSEQAKPDNFDFDSFYKSQMKETKTLSNVPSPSVWGEYSDGSMALSVVTDDSWILMSSSASLSESDMRHIAKGFKKH